MPRPVRRRTGIRNRATHASPLRKQAGSARGRRQPMRVEFQCGAHTTTGHLAVPKSGKGPGVIVIQEWWGLVPHITDLADRLAAEGFTALAPDLYHGRST